MKIEINTEGVSVKAEGDDMIVSSMVETVGGIIRDIAKEYRLAEEAKQKREKR